MWNLWIIWLVPHTHTHTHTHMIERLMSYAVVSATPPQDVAIHSQSFALLAYMY